MKSLEIRKKFFDYFVKNGHTRVESSSLIPAEDPTLLFANAGMNQFKDVFLGKEKRSYTRATSIQKCVRAGGKHNDLDNVGFTRRHLTFFEMMGNFSFGDYFKEDAIKFGWEFLTAELGLPGEKLYVTVFKKDDEAYDIWHTQIGLPKERIVRLGAADNFWQMGDTGPCGPCSEIYLDQGPKLGCGQKSCTAGCDCGRYLEIWNLVFMQFNRQPDGTDMPLKQTGVDTGMGLERLCVVMQDVDSVYGTDLFQPIIKRIEQLSGVSYDKTNEKDKAPFHVLADHIRSTALIITDGCSPSNEGRGYVLRKIIRRAALFAQKLSDKNFFPQLVDALIEAMGDIYPDLITRRDIVVSVLNSEIEQFAANLTRGQAILEKYFAQNQKSQTVGGQQAFKLYDTFGFPIELIKIMAHERGFSVDEKGFEEQMEQQRQQSGKKKAAQADINLPDDITTQFLGYEKLEAETNVSALICGNELVEQAPATQECWVITPESPFFVECGGQVGDQGWIEVGDTQAEVRGLKKIGSAIAAKITVPADLRVGSKVRCVVDKRARLNTMKNHTATHLLQSALMQLLGKQIKQSGSLVAPDYLRFDFTYHENLSLETIREVEAIVNHKIVENLPVTTDISTYSDAIKQGVIAFFGEKYNPENVRIVRVPEFSAELCGGTHVRATGDIGFFKITEVSALSAGNRRVVAVTGPKALELFQDSFETVKQLGQEFKVQAHQVVDAVAKQREQLRQAQSEAKQLCKQLWQAKLPTWLKDEQKVGKIPFLFICLPGTGAGELREIAGALLDKKSGFFFLGGGQDDRGAFVAALSPDHAKTVDMKQFKAWAQDALGVRGGGSATMLQGGGAVCDDSWQAKIAEWLKSQK